MPMEAKLSLVSCSLSLSRQSRYNSINISIVKPGIKSTAGSFMGSIQSGYENCKINNLQKLVVLNYSKNTCWKKKNVLCNEIKFWAKKQYNPILDMQVYV